MKKNILRWLFIGFASAGLFACDSGRVYKKYTGIPEYVWNRDNVVVFRPEIKDDTSTYNVILTVRHSTMYPYRNILVNVEQISPSGESENKEFNVFLRDDNNSFLGEGAGDIWDYEEIIEKNKIFNEPGEYTFKVRHLMTEDQVPFMMEIGLIIENAEN